MPVGTSGLSPGAGPSDPARSSRSPAALACDPACGYGSAVSSSDCLSRALRLLSGRSHFRRQLAEKLRARGFEDGEIEETLDRLAELDYLDDARTASEYIETRRRRGPIGRRRMRAELERRGADPDAVEGALDEAFAAGDDLAGAREAAERWARRRRGGAGEGGVDTDALGRHLDRLGFRTSSVLDVIAEMRAASASHGD